MKLIKKLSAIASAAAITISAGTASAHFQLIYTPEVNFEKAADVALKLIFWHPFENGHVMDMGQPEEFFVINKGKKKDLLPSLKEISFAGQNNTAQGFDASVSLKRNGDYVFALTPAPYYEESEDIYIQQITKAYLNKGGIPTDWVDAVGLATEILPLNKPTNIITGSSFTGQVLSEGKPVAGQEIEIEYIAAEPDMENNVPTASKASPMPGGAIVAITDANGVFTFAIPKAGFWGFAALGSGPAKEFDGKELSQDAVIWVRAFDLPQ